MKDLQDIIDERHEWCTKDDKEYYYLRGKIEAVKAIAAFIKSPGTSRVLAYDYLNINYADACSEVVEISNFIFDASQPKDPIEPSGQPPHSS